MYLIFTIVMIIVIFIFIKSAGSGWVNIFSSAIPSSGITEKFVTHFNENQSQYKSALTVDLLLDRWKAENKVLSYSREPLSNGEYIYTITTTKDFMSILRQTVCGLNMPFLFSSDAERVLRSANIKNDNAVSAVKTDHEATRTVSIKDAKDAVCEYLRRSGLASCSEIMRCNAIFQDYSIKEMTDLCSQLALEGRIEKTYLGKRELYKIK